MTRSDVRPSDLTAEARKRYGLDDPPRSRPRPSRAGTGGGQPCAGSCRCGRRFDRFTDWERHAKATGHRRWDIDVEALR